MTTTLVTAPMVWLPADADLLTIGVLQAARGVGLACAGAPVIAAALAAVATHQVADATAEINILSRVGGALGSALLIVVLTNGLGAHTVGAEATTAFHTTFARLTAASAVAGLAAVWLMAAQRRGRAEVMAR